MARTTYYQISPGSSARIRTSAWSMWTTSAFPARATQNAEVNRCVLPESRASVCAASAKSLALWTILPSSVSV